MAENGRVKPALTPKQEKAVACLLATATITDAAQRAGVGETTLYRWLKEPDFAAAYRDARREAVGQAIARLQHLSAAAAFVLATTMAERSTPAIVKVQAASKILDLAIRTVELEDLEERIAALEAAYDAAKR